MVTLTFERNETHPQGEKHIIFGPFEWVQVTYEFIRDHKDREIACMVDNGMWKINAEYYPPTAQETWSDIVIS